MRITNLTMIAILVAACATTTVPTFYEDFLFNTVGSMPKADETSDGLHLLMKQVAPSQLQSTAVATLQMYMSPEELEKSSKWINLLTEWSETALEQDSSHVFIISTHRPQGYAKTFELSVLKDKEEFSLVVSHRSQQLEVTEQPSELYFETYSTSFGSPIMTPPQSSHKTLESVTQEEITYLKNLLYRSAQIDAIKKNHNSFKNKGLSIPTNQVELGIEVFLQAYMAVAEIFKTTYTKTLKEVIQNRGFDQYSAKSRVVKYTAVPVNSWDRFAPILINGAGLDKAQYKEVRSIVSIANFSDKTEWQVGELDFSIASNKNIINVATFLSHLDEKSNSIAVLGITIEGQFNLAPNLYVYKTKKVIAGGIFSKEIDKVEKRPAAISKEMVKGLNALSIIVAMKKLQLIFNVKSKVKIPNSPSQV